MLKLFIGLTLLVSYLISVCNGLIVPQELPSVLSVVYSVIPPVKKGTDSRVGFGFRLGNHADFQTILEIGPQKYTKPLGKSGDDDNSSGTSKRMADQTDFNKPNKTKPVPNENGSSFLQQWASEMKSKPPQKMVKPQTDAVENESLKVLFSTKNQFPIPKSPVIAESSLRQLQQLMYAKQSDPDKEPLSIGTLPSQTMEAHIALAARESAASTEKLKREKKIKADLSDVSFDD